MDKKKKIIVAGVSVIFAIMMAGFVKIVIFPSNASILKKSKISILTPVVDEQKIDRKTKIQNYEQEEFQKSELNDVVNNFSKVESIKEKKILLDEPIIEGEEMVEDKLKKLVKNNSKKTKKNKRVRREEENIDEELKELMELQNQLYTQSTLPNVPGAYTDPNDIETLLKSYNQYAIATGQQPINPAALEPLTEEKISETDQKVRDRLATSIVDKKTSRNYFQGAGSANDADKEIGLIPAETVDQGTLVNGSTIAIRTKKEVCLSNPPLVIPKGSVIYGKVDISTNRLLIDINSYKKGNKLYLLDFSLYDFDGREGIHLGNRTWPKIPAKVTKDVYDYAYQRGTQASTFGGDSDIQLDQAKDIAILSATKEIGNEVFEKRRVFMPKKYHLWFNINTKK
ncbi:conjugative transposon protein TraM [Aquimarina algiphila]|uniref:conjugative transposon protein TraM n=1 Tax=Aquimarina algiphila TaxID=2047982 RepID=UPI00232B19FF|nr:conjugative transposon protein TraM [Aquimarina algiphila]